MALMAWGRVCLLRQLVAFNLAGYHIVLPFSRVVVMPYLHCVDLKILSV